MRGGYLSSPLRQRADSGIFFELLTYPIPRRQLLIGKVCFNMLLSMLGAFLTVTLGVFVMEVRIRWELC